MGWMECVIFSGNISILVTNSGCYEFCMRKAAGRSSAMVAWAMAPFSPGKKTTVSGVLNS